MVQEGGMALTEMPAFVTEEAADSTVTADLPVEISARYGIILTPPQPIQEPPALKNFNTGFSFIIGTLFLLFVVVALRFRNNSKYVGTLMRNLVETKTRHNVFDDTVRETSLLILLNILWCVCAGIILYRIIGIMIPDSPENSLLSPSENPPLAIASGIIAAVAYTVFMIMAYLGIGTVFSDYEHGYLWLKGFLTSQGVLGFVYFPIALLFLCYPQWEIPLLWISLFLFILAKLVFIWKGMRIFFTQISSWVLFLYYLCSLEAVPLILTFWVAVFIWGGLG